MASAEVDNRLKVLRKGEGQTGHYPYPYDIDGDGKEEFVIGCALWSHEGKQLWNRDKNYHDHADGIVMGNLSGNPKADPLVYACGSGDIERDYAAFNEERTRFFKEQQLDPLPASTGIQAILCRPELLVEIEAIAMFRVGARRH